MASGVTVSTNPDIELLKTVRKDSDDRLRAEMLCGQDHYTVDEVNNMIREDLILNCAKLRKLSGVTTSVKSKVEHYVPTSMAMTLPSVFNLQSTSLSPSPLTGSTLPSSPRMLPAIPTSSDQSNMLTMMMTLLDNQRKVEKEDREAKEEQRRVAKEAKDEERRLEKVAKEAKDEERRLEKESKDEERRLEKEQAKKDKEEERQAERLRIQKLDADKEEERQAERLRIQKLDAEKEQAKKDKEQARKDKEEERKAERLRIEKLEKDKEEERKAERLRIEKLEADREVERKKCEDEREVTRKAERIEEIAARKVISDEKNKLRQLAIDEAAKRASDELAKLGKPEAKFQSAFKLMKPLLYTMPENSNDLTLYFENVDKMFNLHKIPDEFRIQLLTPFITETARRVLMSMSEHDLGSYGKWKGALLRAYRLTPSTYRKNFNAASREPNESWTQFATRLACLLKYYLASRKVVTFEKLVSLILSDKLKDATYGHAKYHISDREGNDWFDASQVADLMDIYDAERGPSYVQDNKKSYQSFGATNQATNNRGGAGIVSPYTHIESRDRIRCYTCNNLGHVARNCGQQARGGGVVSVQPSRGGGFTGRQLSRGGGVTGGQLARGGSLMGASRSYQRRCFLCNDANHLANRCPKRGTKMTRLVQNTDQDEMQVESYDMNDCDEINTINRVSTERNVSEKFRDDEEIKLPLGTVMVNFGAGLVSCIVDSGAEVTVLRPEMIQAKHLSSSEGYAKTTLQSAFGKKVVARLMNIPASLSQESRKQSRQSDVLLSCAITSDLNGNKALITPQDYRSLVIQSEVLIPEVKILSGTSMLYQDPEVSVINHADKLESVAMSIMDSNAMYEGRTLNVTVKQVTPLSTDLIRVEEIIEFKKSQISDDTLKSCWSEAGKEKSNFLIRCDNQLLYHRNDVGGFEVQQLVLPTNRRRLVMEQAHDSIWSMHFGVEKTLQRIEPHFYWTTMPADVKVYVKSCIPCQLITRKTKYDRIPISPVARAATSFEHVNIDLIGPLDPASSRGHKSVLCLIDNCTRWVEAVPLKTLTAKELCDALISIFCRIGIPRILVSDNGTNMVSGLTQELYKRLGVELRRSTPYHPEGNSLVERWNANLKHMLHHVVKGESPRDWDRRLPYLLWAYREIPNATTGLSPYQLVYGRTSRGPLSVLRDTWSGDVVDVPLIHDTAHRYLAELKANLQVGLDLAETNALKAQKAYTDQYNLLSKEKTFEVGDLVLVLLPDSSNKLIAQWQGPATVVLQVSEHSYRVSLDTGAVKVLHANHLRLFVTRVNSVGIIFEDDEDFGVIEYCPTSLDEVKKELNDLDLSHLNEVQRLQLLKLLQRYSHVFSDKPGDCNVACHEINLEEGFQPKAMHPYRIPDKLKVEVDRQIDELLKDGKVRPSFSPYAHPIVCVAKPNGDIRVCTDLRHVNSGTVNDAYPMPRAEEMLMRVSAAKYLTTLDCTSGYWQIPMRESDISKTAFVTHRGLYEWLVMPFGLKTAGNTFQRVADTLLRPHSEYAGAYIDDTIVFSSEWRKHLIHLEAVFQAFSDAGMTLKLSKCVFAKGSVKFIGHEVGSGKKTVLKNKVEAIKAIPEPYTKKMLRSFLGMTNFYRTYIPGYSQIALPLTEMTKGLQPTKIKFGEIERVAFGKLKEALCDSVTLHSPVSDRPFIIRTDASDYAVGACLSQTADDNCEYPIAFASSKLSDVQKRWSTIEKEAYAVIYALQKFDVIVYGSRIELFSDHNPLKYLVSCAPKSAKLTRWALSLSRYNINVQHIKGTDNVSADFLSRCFQ